MRELQDVNVYLRVAISTKSCLQTANICKNNLQFWTTGPVTPEHCAALLLRVDNSERLIHIKVEYHLPGHWLVGHLLRVRSPENRGHGLQHPRGVHEAVQQRDWGRSGARQSSFDRQHFAAAGHLHGRLRGHWTPVAVLWTAASSSRTGPSHQQHHSPKCARCHVQVLVRQVNGRVWFDGLFADWAFGLGVQQLRPSAQWRTCPTTTTSGHPCTGSGCKFDCGEVMYFLIVLPPLSRIRQWWPLNFLLIIPSEGNVRSFLLIKAYLYQLSVKVAIACSLQGLQGFRRGFSGFFSD